MEQEIVHRGMKHGCHGAVMRQKRRRSGFGASFRDECWRKMRVMHAAFADAESDGGAGSREREEERLRDEEAWSQMANEGCPNGRQSPYSQQDIIRMENEAT